MNGSLQENARYIFDGLKTAMMSCIPRYFLSSEIISRSFTAQFLDHLTEFKFVNSKFSWEDRFKIIFDQKKPRSRWSTINNVIDSFNLIVNTLSERDKTTFMDMLSKFFNSLYFLPSFTYASSIWPEGKSPFGRYLMLVMNPAHISNDSAHQHSDDVPVVHKNEIQIALNEQQIGIFNILKQASTVSDAVTEKFFCAKCKVFQADNKRKLRRHIEEYHFKFIIFEGCHIYPTKLGTLDCPVFGCTQSGERSKEKFRKHLSSHEKHQGNTFQC
ncbi:MAG: hypothetical protein RL728_743 [Bacteroidota bacterium]|jgi:hypothetical protein